MENLEMLAGKSGDVAWKTGKSNKKLWGISSRTGMFFCKDLRLKQQQMELFGAFPGRSNWSSWTDFSA